MRNTDTVAARFEALLSAGHGGARLARALLLAEAQRGGNFHAQPWFKPNPRFNYKLLSDVDKKNAHFIGAYEHSLYDTELRRRRDEIYARAGKIFPDKPTWTTRDGKEVKACERPKGARCADEECGYSASSYPGCYYAKQPWYTPDPKFSEEKINPTDRIELGLLSRALGEFATDEDKRGQSERSLDRLLSLAELRALSLRDLRLLRNTIYARRGRAFKSPVLRDHFARMDWYKVDAAYSDAALTKNDTRNIALIRSVENEFGGALSDEDWLIEPATDGA